jgi:SAM-dependent methyltransferase
LATARRKVPTGEFKIGDLAALPYEADTFDTVVACDCLLSQKDAATAIAELSRVCKPTGQVCVVVWGPPHESDYSRVYDAMQSLLPQRPFVTPLALSGDGVLESHIAQVGLRIWHEETVRLDYRFQDFKDYWSCGKELGGIKLIVHTVGEANVRQAAYHSAQQSIQPNGELVMRNTYRLVILTPKPQ